MPAKFRDFFGLSAGQMPQFDIVHRGMGPDAHTASLFPGDPLIDDRTGIAAATFAKKFNQWRVTLLPGVLLAARNTIFLVAGKTRWRRFTPYSTRHTIPRSTLRSLATTAIR
jgi:6-phosphogluconolactonase